MDIQHRITRARLENQLENAQYAIRGFRMQQQHEGCSDELWDAIEMQINRKNRFINDLKSRMGE